MPISMGLSPETALPFRKEGRLPFQPGRLIHLLAAGERPPIPGLHQAFKMEISISTSCPTRGYHKAPENNLLQI